MGQYLAGTIESVLMNLGADDGYFVIDGGFSDNSLNILKSYEHRISGWISELDKSYADALKKQLSLALTKSAVW
jgi:hypothetical protein